MAKRVAQMGATAAQLASYVGIARQVIINETTWRVHIMDGVTLGGIQMAKLSDIPDVSGFLTKGDATGTYLTIANAQSTYLTINNANAKFLTISNAQTTFATQTSVNGKISVSGDRGSLAGYETLTSTASAVTITDGSPDDQAVTGAVAVTVSNGTAGKVWTKTVGITSESATISLGSSWFWVGGKAPTVAANCVLVLKWYGTFGVANLILTA